MALANNFLLFSKSEQGLFSIGGQTVRNVFQAQICLFFQMNGFPFYVFWHHQLHNFLSFYFQEHILKCISNASYNAISLSHL